MRPALFLIPLCLLSACGPSEKPADVATAAEVEAAQAAISKHLPQPASADPAEKAGVCRREIGDDEADKLIERCNTLSPGTCQADSSCQVIRDEIKRACDNLPINRQLPAECG